MASVKVRRGFFTLDSRQLIFFCHLFVTEIVNFLQMPYQRHSNIDDAMMPPQIQLDFPQQTEGCYFYKMGTGGLLDFYYV